MRPRFLADENFNAKIIAGVLRRERSVDFQTAKAANLLGLRDPEVLAIAARENRVLVSHDQKTMPGHFSRFVQESRSPGLLIMARKLAIGEAIEYILLVWAASESDEWINQIEYVPF